MTGTPQTIAQLLASYPTNGAPGNIGPVQFQNHAATLGAVSPISVMQYGAVGDGITDDSVAIQAALTAAGAAGGGTVMLTPGHVYRYASTTWLTVPANVTLWGYGATLQPLVPNNFSAIRLAGNKANCMGVFINSAATIRNVTGDGSCGGIYVGDGSNTLTQNNIIRDNYIYKVGAASIYMVNAFAPNVFNNTVDSGLSDGIHCTMGSNGVKVIGNRVLNAGDDYLACISYSTDATGPCFDIQWIGNYVEGNVFANGADIHSNNVLMLGNIIRNTASAGIYVGTEEGLSYQNIDIIGNYIEHGDINDVHDATFFVRAVAGLSLTNLNIIGNHIYNPGSFYGIEFSGTSNNVKNVKFSDNFITNAPNAGIVVAASACANLLISNNMINTTGSVGINVTSGNQGVSIQGNHISAATSYGIQNAAASASIVGNFVYDPSSALTNGFNLVASTAGCTVTGNNWGPKGQNLNSNTVVANQ